jgi:hypothetical protein
MTHRKLRSLVGASVLVAAIALWTATAASPYAHVTLDAGHGGGAASVAAPAWADLMDALQACAAGSGCTVTVAGGGQAFQWTTEGPMLALAGAGVIVCEAVEPARAGGGGPATEAVRGAAPQQLAP